MALASTARVLRGIPSLNWWTWAQHQHRSQMVLVLWPKRGLIRVRIPLEREMALASLMRGVPVVSREPLLMVLGLGVIRWKAAGWLYSRNCMTYIANSESHA